MNDLELDFAKMKTWIAYGSMQYGQAIEKILEDKDFNNETDKIIYRQQLVKKFIQAK